MACATSTCGVRMAIRCGMIARTCVAISDGGALLAVAVLSLCCCTSTCDPEAVGTRLPTWTAIRAGEKPDVVVSQWTDAAATSSEADGVVRSIAGLRVREHWQEFLEQRIRVPSDFGCSILNLAGHRFRAGEGRDRVAFAAERLTRSALEQRQMSPQSALLPGPFGKVRRSAVGVAVQRNLLPWACERESVHRRCNRRNAAPV